MSSPIPDTSLSWASPCPRLAPLLFPLIWDHTFKRHLLVLSLLTVITNRVKDSLNQGSSSWEKVCTKFRLSYILQFPLPVLISDESTHTHRYHSYQSKRLLTILLFSKEKGKCCPGPEFHNLTSKISQLWKNISAWWNETSCRSAKFSQDSFFRCMSYSRFSPIWLEACSLPMCASLFVWLSILLMGSPTQTKRVLFLQHGSSPCLDSICACYLEEIT